jgi:hypothetical protein
MASFLPLPNTVGTPLSLTLSLGNRNNEYQNNTSKTHGGATVLCFVSDLRIGLMIAAYFALMCRRLACQRLVVMY